MSEDFMYANPTCLKNIQVFQNSVKQELNKVWLPKVDLNRYTRVLLIIPCP